MRKLKDILTEMKSDYRLTRTQQEVLALIYQAPTPETAYNATMGAENLHTARTSLVEWGYVIVEDDNTATLTAKGDDQLKSYGIVTNGELTEYGTELTSTASAEKETWD
jgi:predicted transcriptional regulator